MPLGFKKIDVEINGHIQIVSMQAVTHGKTIGSGIPRNIRGHKHH